MQFTRHLRRLAALIPLALAGLSAQPGLGAERTQHAIVLPTKALSAPGSDYADAPRQIRGSLLLARDGNIYFGSSAGGNGAGAIGRLTPSHELSTVYALKDDGTEGVSVYGPLVQGPAPDDSLYGTAYFGGDRGLGTLFRVTLDGEFTVLYDFGGGKPNPALPYTGVVFGPDGYLYGTTLNGGARNKGTVWRIATDGTGFSVLHEFNGNDGENPEGTLIVGPDGYLYGTTLVGGSSNRGTIYRISTSGGLEVVYSFPKLGQFRDGVAVNATGANPRSALMLSTDGNFYGTAAQGGEYGYGTLFRMTPGPDFQVSVIHSFRGPHFGGSAPLAPPVQDEAGNFYGTTSKGGPYNYGTAWRISPDGEFRLLHGFAGTSAEGHSPQVGLLLANGTIYAASYSEGGSTGGYGAIIRLQEETDDNPLPIDIQVSARDITSGGSGVEVTWNAPPELTCRKVRTSDVVGTADWTGDAPSSGSQTLLPFAGPVIFLLSCSEPDDGDETTTEVVRNAYAAVVATPPLLAPVDGGASGAGSLSLGWLLLAAALLCFKVKKEIRPSCP
jgi:uncharacterized repeat protein (TIGR03803 family)